MKPDEIETLPPMYAAVLETGNRLMRQPGGASTDTIGAAAWASLTDAERRAAMPNILGAYVSRVHEEENVKRLRERAADPTHTYLADGDVASLWDSIASTPNGHDEVIADSAALLNVLCELDLLLHRLAMRDRQGGA